MLLHVLAEGYSERKFAEEMLAEWLAPKQLYVVARCVETHRDEKRGLRYSGGVTSYAKLRRDLTGWLKENSSKDARFTTMLDYYALPGDFPGIGDADEKYDAFEKVACLEEAFRKDIGDYRLIPYIQLHEFEALLFVDPGQLENLYLERSEEIGGLKEIADQFGNPELIDNGPETAPSKRILRKIPEYKKMTAGVETLKRIGIENLKAKCSHFAEWLGKLEGISNG